MLNPVARCNTLGGTLPAGQILQRLCYWTPKTKLKCGGFRWVALSSEEWEAETGLTPKQYKSGLALLKERGLVVAIQRPFKGRKVAWLRLSEHAQEVLLGTSATETEGPGGTSKKSLAGPINISEIKKGRLKVKVSPENPGSDNKDSEAGEMKVSEVKAMEGKLKVHHHKPDSTKLLEKVWKETYFEVYGHPIMNMKTKDQHLLGQFMKYCPPKTAAEMLELIIRHWDEFVAEVSTKTGTKKTPTHPQVVFLLAYAGIAVCLVLEQKKVTAKSGLSAPEGQKVNALVTEDSCKPSLFSQDVQLISKEDEDKPVTKAEMLAILNGK